MLRDVRHHSRRLLTVAVVVASCSALPGCAGSNSGATTSSTRPIDRLTSPATVSFVHPRDGQVVGRPLTVEVAVKGGRIVAPTRAPLSGEFGHVHLSLDGGAEMQMLYGPTFDLGALDPGPHTLQAEFVATDHRPFANRPNTTVVFTVE